MILTHMNSFVSSLKQPQITVVITISCMRKALLNGLSPKENRTIPPINYPRVYKIKEQYGDLTIEINGEIKDINEIEEHFKYVDGVMIGEACNNPLILREINSSIYEDKPIEMTEFFEKMFEYILKESNHGTGVHLLQDI